MQQKSKHQSFEKKIQDFQNLSSETSYVLFNE